MERPDEMTHRIGMIILDVVGKLIFISPPAAVLLGRPIHVGMHFDELNLGVEQSGLIAPLDFSSLLQGISRGQLGEGFSCLIGNADGQASQLWLDVVTVADALQNKQIIISFQKRPHRIPPLKHFLQKIPTASRENAKPGTSEKSFRTTFEQSGIGIAHVDFNRRFIRINAHYCEMLGHSEAELIGQMFDDFVYSAEKEAKIHLDLPQNEKEVLTYEKRYGHKDGTSFWAEFTLSCAHDEVGKPLYIIVIVQHVDQKVKTRQALQESDRRFRQIADSISEVFWIWDFARETYVYMSPACEKVNGEKPEFFMEDPYRLLNSVYPEDSPILQQTLHRQLLGEETHTEYRMLRKGTIYWVSVKAFPIRDHNGKIIRVAGLTADITERKESEAALQKAKQLAEEANRAKSAFLANMSHEIRTPLGAILGFTELLKRESLTREERQQFAQSIDRNGRDLTRLIDDILDLSKVEAGRVEIEKLKIPLPGLIKDLMQSYDVVAKEKGIRLILEYQGLIPDIIFSDPLRIRQILRNIVGNAIKFTSQGEVKVLVKHTEQADPPGKRVVSFAVSDTGCGISADQAQHLFQAFSQADSSTTRTYGGTGLGLALSRRLARLLGGDVELQRSEPGLGSNFVVTIDEGSIPDIKFVTCSTEDEDSAAPQASRFDNNFKGIRILLAEDALDNQAIIKEILASQGANIDVVDNGAEAVNKALQMSYDLILMDIQMPVLDGYGATQQLREKGYNRPIIALTAHALNEQRVRSLGVGFDDHLSKPINFQVLFDTIARFTGKFQMDS